LCLQILSETVPSEVQAANTVAELDKQRLLYCERFIELLIDLLSQLPTRRFVRTLLEDKAILIKCRMSPLLEHLQGTPSLFYFVHYKEELQALAHRQLGT
jgi:hypothetical protein